MAEKWDADAEIGGVWTAAVQRIVVTAAGPTALPMAAPCTLDLWGPATDPVAGPPVLSVAGVLSGDTRSVRFTIGSAQLAALGVGIFEQRLTLGDPDAGPIVMARGWFSVRGRVTDL